MRPAATRYVRSGETRIAYRVLGQGSVDLLLLPGFLSNLDILPEDPGYCRLVKRLSAFGRLVLLDRRGTGLSDRYGPVAADAMAINEDLYAVVEATGCGRTVLIGASDGAALAVRFALRYPERVRALVLVNGYDHFHSAVMDARKLRAFLGLLEQAWGTGVTLPLLAPEPQEACFVQWWARLERLSASPTDAVALLRSMASIDLRQQLPALHIPTLVLHRAKDVLVDPEGSRRLARGIPGARLMELPGQEHLLWMGNVDQVADAIEESVTGDYPLSAGRRILSTLLVARLDAENGRGGLGTREQLVDERLECFKDAVRHILERYGGQLEWRGRDKLVICFNAPSHATCSALALRDAAIRLGVSIGQGIHSGEIDASLSPLSGGALEAADRIASAARPREILLSRLTRELMSGFGLQVAQRGSLLGDEARDPLAIVALASERHLEPAQQRVCRADLDLLSTREREVLSLLAEGLSNTHIAIRLGRSEHTVKRHVANILLKLDLPSRSAAAAALAAHQPVARHGAWS
ncbi:MAG TPA: alpha/beta fold hydrolase [Kiloniellales bacterium]|nr:alpha/beta fold hydrolase [Kiloniellales bacterium]